MVPCGPSSARACWIARPLRSRVMAIAVNRPSRSGECTNTSSACAPSASRRTFTTVSPGEVPRSAIACQATWSARLRRNTAPGMRLNSASASSSSTACADISPRALSRVSATRSTTATGFSSPRRSASRVAVRRSVSSRSFHAFHSRGEVPAMSAQVSRYR